MQYAESLSLKLVKNGKELPSRTETSDVARSEPGAKPGGVVAEQIKVTADVIAVDADKHTVTLKGPNRTVDLTVNDPKQLALIKVGDKINAVYTQAVAVDVKPAAEVGGRQRARARRSAREIRGLRARRAARASVCHIARLDFGIELLPEVQSRERRHGLVVDDCRGVPHARRRPSAGLVARSRGEHESGVRDRRRLHRRDACCELLRTARRRLRRLTPRRSGRRTSR